MRASSSVLAEFDHLTDEEFGFLKTLVRPYGITREQYRDELAAGRFDAGSFRDNVHVMRVATELAAAPPKRGPALRLVVNTSRQGNPMSHTEKKEEKAK